MKSPVLHDESLNEPSARILLAPGRLYQQATGALCCFFHLPLNPKCLLEMSSIKSLCGSDSARKYKP